MKIVLLIGLPGSGKSHYMSLLSDDLWVKIDDPMGSIDLPETDKNIIIADVNLIFDNVRNAAISILTKKYGSDIELVFFENNPTKCLTNINYRNDGRKVTDFINRYTHEYNPPCDRVIEIWQP